MANAHALTPELKKYLTTVSDPLRILVHLTKSSSDATACTAFCLSYPIYAQGTTPENAVENVLAALTHHLALCLEEHAWPLSYDEGLQRAFEFDAKELPVSENILSAFVGNSRVMAKVSAELAKALKRARLQVRKTDKLPETELVGA